MPRREQSGVASAFRQVQRQARALLTGLRKQIHVKEAELEGLKAQEVQLGQLAGRSGGAGTEPGRRGRINWRAVLAQLPRQFKASDIRRVRGLREKRPSEIFAAITRWIEAGTVKRKARGQYERATESRGGRA